MHVATVTTQTGRAKAAENAYSGSSATSPSQPPSVRPAFHADKPAPSTASDRPSQIGTATAAKPAPALTASPCLATSAPAVATTSGATCNTNAQVDDKEGIKELLTLTMMSLASITNEAMKFAITRGQEIHLSFTEKRSSLRQVRDTAMARFPDRAFNIQAFMKQVRQYDATSLAQAVDDGDTELVREHLEDGITPTEAKSDSEISALTSAALKGHEPIMSLLLPHSSNRDLLDSLDALLSKASKEHDWHKLIPTARKLIAHLKQWEAIEPQIGKALARNRDKLDEESLARAKGFHQAAFSHLKLQQAAKSKATAQSLDAADVHHPYDVNSLAQAVRDQDLELIRRHLCAGVRSTESKSDDSLSPLEIAVEMDHAEIVRLLLPHSDHRSAVDALHLLVKKVATSKDWDKWVPMGRQIVDRLEPWTGTEEALAIGLASNRKGFSEAGLVRAKAFHQEAFAYFRPPQVMGSTSTAGNGPVDTAATGARSTSSISFSPETSPLINSAMYARIESVDFRLQQSSKLEKMEALVAVACELHFAEANLALSHDELVQKRFADSLVSDLEAKIEQRTKEIEDLKAGAENSETRIGILVKEIGDLEVEARERPAKLKEHDRKKLERLRVVAKNILATFAQGSAREEAVRHVRKHAGVFARHIEALID